MNSHIKTIITLIILITLGCIITYYNWWKELFIGIGLLIVFVFAYSIIHGMFSDPKDDDYYY